MLKNAVFNNDRTHRYTLARIWNSEVSLILFIGLNPSTADELRDDNTVTRLTTFAQNWGYGGFYLVNCYPWIETDSDDLDARLMEESDKILNKAKTENKKHIIRVWNFCHTPVFMWGAHEVDPGMVNWLKNRFRGAKCFGHTKDGHPKHPLYLPNETNLVDFIPKIRKWIISLKK